MNSFARFFATAAVASAWAAFAPAASALTIGFDGVQDYGTVLGSGGTGSPYSEDGFTVTALDGILASYITAGTVLLVDSGPDFTTALSISGPGLFTANGLTFTSLGYDSFDELPANIGNVIIRGFVGDTAVAVMRLSASIISGTVQSVLFGPEFANLDRLEIELAYPRRAGACGSPCGQIEIGSLDLAPAPVPLPATGGLLALAGLTIAGISRRRRG